MLTHILLLAAGSSSRMGQSKQLMKLKGEPLLVTAVKTGLTASAYVTVVLGAQADIHRRLLEDFAVHVVDNPDWSKGIGGSLKVGLKAVRMSVPPPEAVLVMLCDQPGVTANHLKALIASAGSSPKAIVASAYNNTLGVPALFKREMFDRLTVIGDESGASQLIRQHPDASESIACPEGALDLDTPADVKRYLGSGGG